MAGSLTVWLCGIGPYPEDTAKLGPCPQSDQQADRKPSWVPIARMALFAVNTGRRDREGCRRRWEWDVKATELTTSVFIIPGASVKNGQDR